jgi:hypothetical protein
MSDCEIIALSILGETIGIDSENYLFGKLKSDHRMDEILWFGLTMRDSVY